jgi:hypothetical protein
VSVFVPQPAACVAQAADVVHQAHTVQSESDVSDGLATIFASVQFNLSSILSILSLFIHSIVLPNFIPFT